MCAGVEGERYPSRILAPVEASARYTLSRVILKWYGRESVGERVGMDADAEADALHSAPLQTDRAREPTVSQSVAALSGRRYTEEYSRLVGAGSVPIMQPADATRTNPILAITVLSRFQHEISHIDTHTHTHSHTHTQQIESRLGRLGVCAMPVANGSADFRDIPSATPAESAPVRKLTQSPDPYGGESRPAWP